MRSRRLAGVILGALVVASGCGQTRNSSADSSGLSAGASAAAVPAAAAESLQKSGAPASPPKQRAADLPVRRRDSTPARQVDNPCGGIHVNVMVRSSALTSGANSEAAL